MIGNHDSEILDDRAAQMKYMQALPYSLAEPGPADVDGVGNCKLLRAPISRNAHSTLTQFYVIARYRQTLFA